VISKITLPENGQVYTFYYGSDVSPHSTTNPYGLLSEIDYPSGGWVTYSWKLSDTPNALADYPGEYDAGWQACSTTPGTFCPAPVSNGCMYLYSTPVVASRSVYFGESSVPSLTQTFTYSTSWAGAPSGLWVQKNTNITTVDGVTGKSMLTSYSYSPVSVGGPPYIYTSWAQIPVESSVSYYDWGSTSSPLQTHAKSWYDQFNLKSDTTELAQGSSTMMSEVVYCYAGTSCAPNAFSQLKSKSEYDYGNGAAGPLLRQTTTTYQAFSGTPGYIADAPCQMIVYDGSNNRFAETDYLYDGGSTLCATETSTTATTAVTVVSGTHDESKFGPSKTTPRGNVTTRTQWANVGTSPVTTYTYDETGQVTSMTDPCGNGACTDMAGSSHTTYYYYADSYTTGSNTCTSANGPAGNTNALLTKIVYPPTNSVVHSECFSYDYNSGQLTGSEDENGQLTTYAYNDPFFRPRLVNYPDGGQTAIAYSDIAPSPSVTTTKLISSGVNLGTTAVMDGMGHLVQTQVTTDPDGTDYVDTSYDGIGRALSVSNPHRSSSQLTDGTTSTTYDGLGRTILIQRPDGSSVQTAYAQTCSVSTNAAGTTVTDETGKLRKSCSDGLGRLVEVDEPGAGAGDGSPGSATVSINENSGQVSNTFQVCYYQGQPPVLVCQNETVYNGGTITLTVDGVPYSTSYGPTPPTGPFTTSYIASALASQINGNVTAVANGSTITLTATTTGADTNYSLLTSATYNSATCNSSPCFSGPSFYASAPASLTGGTDPGLGSSPLVTLYSYNTLNNLTCAVQKGTDATAFSTCAAASATWRPRSFVYDSLSRLTSATNPESGTITYAYDLNSNLQSKVAPRPGQTGTLQVTTNYKYDDRNRLTNTSYNGVSTAPLVYAYDGTTLNSGCGQNPPAISSTYAVGRRTGMCGSKSGSSWSYDKMGRPVLESTRSFGSVQKVLTVNYAYNQDGSLNTLTYPSGDVVTYTVGGAGRVTRVADSTNNFVTSATYAPPGLLTGMTSGTGIVTSNIYNDRLQPVLLSAGVTGQNPVFSLCYDFHLHVAFNNSPCSLPAYATGDNGNVFQVLNNVDSTRSAVYTYDSLNRLAQANTITTTGSNCWGEVYTIDSWSNLTSIAGVSTMGGCSAEGLSATATTKNQLSGVGLLYDAAGNVTQDNLGNQPTYDAENKIVTDAGFTYYYDADGTRMEKTSGSSGTMYWIGPSGALTETDLTGAINEEYIYFNGQRIARVDRPSGTISYYFSDKLNSASVIASATGAVKEQYFYFPYGGQQSSTGSDPNHYKFTGKERDTESNLDQFGARYYTSSIGRFMTPDWAARPTAVPYAVYGDPQSLNLYTYVRNDPVTNADADGHISPEAMCPDPHGCNPFSDDQENKDAPAPSSTQAQNNKENKSSGQNLHVCGDFMCNAKGVTVMPAPASVRGLSEDYKVEFAIALFVTKLAGLGLDVLVPDSSSSGPKLEPEPDIKPPGHDPKTWEWGTPSRKKPAERGEGSFWDPSGGEWRLHQPDKYHSDPHWNFNSHENPSSPWQDIPIL
jgi:RHS repeat-associated protein